MKLIFAIVNKDDSYDVLDSLTKEHFSVTKLSSSGGFLRSGKVTFLIGTGDDQVDKAIDIIASKSKERTEMIPNMDYMRISPVIPIASNAPVHVGGATIFVVNIERFEKV